MICTSSYHKTAKKRDLPQRHKCSFALLSQTLCNPTSDLLKTALLAPAASPTQGMMRSHQIVSPTKSVSAASLTGLLMCSLQVRVAERTTPAEIAAQCKSADITGCVKQSRFVFDSNSRQAMLTKLSHRRPPWRRYRKTPSF